MNSNTFIAALLAAFIASPALAGESTPNVRLAW